MADLRTQVVRSAADLRSAWTGLQAGPNISLPANCYEKWLKRAMLHRVLDGAVQIFPARGAAWATVQAVAASVPNPQDPANNTITFSGLPMDFAVARHLAITSYVSVTWSIYDRLTNVCGRLAGISDLAENPRQNPRACEDFLGKKDTLGFTGHLHIQQAYAWPLKVAYKIRNWLVHEGYEEGGVPLFTGERISDGFRIHADAMDYLQKCCGYKSDNGKIECCCLHAADECWPTGELLTILSRYHAEIDAMLEGLVKWSVDSLIGQIRAFAVRP